MNIFCNSTGCIWWVSTQRLVTARRAKRGKSWSCPSVGGGGGALTPTWRLLHRAACQCRSLCASQPRRALHYALIVRAPSANGEMKKRPPLYSIRGSSQFVGLIFIFAMKLLPQGNKCRDKRTISFRHILWSFCEISNSPKSKNPNWLLNGEFYGGGFPEKRMINWKAKNWPLLGNSLENSIWTKLWEKKIILHRTQLKNPKKLQKSGFNYKQILHIQKLKEGVSLTASTHPVKEFKVNKTVYFS